MNNLKIPFYRKLKRAIINPEKYQEFALEKTSCALKYFTKLILLFCVIACIAITYQYVHIASNAINLIKEDVPDFTVKDNILSINSEEPVVITKLDDKIEYSLIFDTSDEVSEEKLKEYNQKLSLYNLGAIFLKDKVLIQTQGETDNQLTYSYEELMKKFNIENINKQDLVEKIDSINTVSMIVAIYITLLIYLFVAYFIATLLETVLMMVIGFLTSKIVKVDLKSSQIYNIVLYSLTLPILLNAINILLNIFVGFEIQYFQVMYTAVAYIYLITAIMLIKTDLIKLQAEVGKIEEKQNEIMNENEEQTEEKEDEKQKDSNTNGETPEGSV